MRYRILGVVVAAVALAGCAGGGGGGEAEAPAGTTGAGAATSAAATPGPSRSADEKADLAASGVGPYTVGVKLADLRARRLVVDVRPQAACQGLTLARGTDDYQSPSLVFFNDQLQYLSVDSPLARTTEGARVGMPVGQVQAKYPDAATLNSVAGGGMALLAKDSSGKYALLFRISTAGTVESIEAGLAETLEFRFTDREGC
jgi:hypothetical protein